MTRLQRHCHDERDFLEHHGLGVQRRAGITNAVLRAIGCMTVIANEVSVLYSGATPGNVRVQRPACWAQTGATLRIASIDGWRQQAKSEKRWCALVTMYNVEDQMAPHSCC